MQLLVYICIIFCSQPSKKSYSSKKEIEITDLNIFIKDNDCEVIYLEDNSLV